MKIKIKSGGVNVEITIPMYVTREPSAPILWVKENSHVEYCAIEIEDTDMFTAEGLRWVKKFMEEVARINEDQQRADNESNKTLN